MYLYRSFLALLLAGFTLSARAQLSGVFRELYTGIGGGAVSDLTNAPSFPGSPSQTNIITDFFEAPTDFADNYGQRLRALILPPVTGNYIFWIASDDGSNLYLSTDENPANKVLIANVNSWTSSREWTKEANQQSVAIPLVGGRRYYIEALQKEGGGGDNLAVRWQLPSSVIEEPIPASRLVAYGIPPTSPPTITQQPASISVVEGSPATFSIQVSNADPLTYQWQRNTANIPSANGYTYTVAATAMTDNGAGFRCVLTNTLGVRTSAVAVLTVTPDATAPTVTKVLNVGTNLVVVSFSEPVEAASANIGSNFTIDHGVGVSAALISSDTRSVQLTTTTLTFGTVYTVTIKNVRDRAATPNTIVLNTQASFTATDFTPQDIGSPGLVGTCSPAVGGTDVVGGGSDIGGTSDSFQFCYQQRSGDFDLAVRVESIDLADAATKAGLMARETLDSNSRFAATLATPSLGGTFFESRSTPAGAAVTSGMFPANFPGHWLRLQRVGNVFNGFASFDGQGWVQLGSATETLPQVIYLGYAVSSHTTSQTATARFRDFGTVVSPTIVPLTLPTEPLGPSSRKTGLVISEIMYHPAARADLKNLEYVEIYNSNPFFEDISGYRIAGDVDFTFPDGTVLPGGGFLAIAAAPADITSVYGIANVTGPYVGTLKNSGTVRLMNDVGSVYLEVPYDSLPPWPVGAAATGHSIVLARPTYGEGFAKAWAISDAVGGSPGAGEAYHPSALRSVMINEFLAHTDDPMLDYIELYNHGNALVDLTGCFLTDDPTTNRFTIPPGTTIPARGFVYFDQNQLGFSLRSAGGEIYFKNATQTRIIDAIAYEAQENSTSYGRYPDGATEMYPLTSRTPGATNSAVLVRDIVINELMYDPISGNSDDCYLELYNKGLAPVNIGAWTFTAGINFTFPSNTIVPANSYLVVAKNLTNLLSHYANLSTNNTLGDYSGSLSHSGERVAIAMPDQQTRTNNLGVVVTNTIYIVVDEVTYGTGGRWGEYAGGGGSSLELIDSRSNHRLAPNWADSDESAKAPWTNIETTGVLDNGAGAIDFVQIGLLQRGECLVDNIELIPGTVGANYITNPTFESGLTGWSPQGDHTRSSQEVGGGYGGGNCLHIRATDQMWTGANSVVGTLSNTTLAQGQTATLRFKARWLRGWPEPLLRVHGNYLEATGRLNIPANLGTPGLPNSRLVANAGPAITEVNHSPAVPAANQNVVVTARLHDPNGLQTATLNYRIDPATTYTAVNLVDNGTGGDAIANDGIYSATLPGQPAGKLVAFYISARDTGSATTKFPSVLNDGGPSRDCLVYFGDTVLSSSFGSYRLWLTQANNDRWAALGDLSNELIDGTWVSGDRVIYNMTGHFAGSPYHQQFDSPTGSACHYNLSMPEDDLFLGATSFNKIHAPGNGPYDDDSIQREQTAYSVARGLGIPWNYRRYVNMFVNGVRRVNGSGTGLMEDTQVPNGDVVNARFPKDNNGDLFKFQPWFEFDVNGAGNNNYSWCMLNQYNTTGGTKKLARYRWNYQIRRVQDSANRYTNVFNLVDAANLPANTPAFIQNMDAMADVDEWVRTFASVHSVGDWDHFGSQNAQNMYGYKPGNGPWQLLIWDHNIVIGNASWGPGANLFSYTGGDSGMANLYSTPVYMRSMWRAYKDICNGPFLASKVNTLVDAKYAAFLANGITVASPAAIKSWIASARDSILSQLAGANANASFSVSGSATFSTNQNYITVSGTAPVEVATLTINGITYKPVWTDIATWKLQLALGSGLNTFEIQGWDRLGNAIGTAAATLSVTYTGASDPVVGRVMINEIMYNPVAPAASFVELYNSSSVNAYDLSGYRLNGADFIFPGGSIITAGGYLVVAKDTVAFAAAYGKSIPISGLMNGNLDNTGETLQLIEPGATPDLDVIIDEVTYDVTAPWPSAANGFGPSLQLIDPAQDNRRAMNWAAATTNSSPVQAQPQWKYATATGVESSITLYLYLQAAGDVYIDDIKVVAGSVPEAGANLLANGDFESALSGPWTIGSVGNNSASVISTSVKHGGASSLHLIASAGGTTRTSAIWQDLALTAGSTYTLSFWYLENPNGGTLTARFSGSWINLNEDLSLPAVTATSAMYTPGAANSILKTLPTFPQLWLNEVQPANATGIADRFGHRHPWVELYNSGASAIDLTGYYLAGSYSNLTQWAFPSISIGAGQYKIVYVDGNSAESINTELHAGFAIPALTGSVALSHVSGGATNVVDYLNYNLVNTDRSYGALPDGRPNKRLKFYYATPGAANNGGYPGTPVTINEWMASNTHTVADPADGKFDDWFELYNAGASTVDLTGFTLCNSSNTPAQFIIPSGYSIPAGGYLLVWADKDSSQNSPSRPDLHLNFNLSKAGEYIGLYAPNGSLVDSVVFGAQTNDISQGRWPDGNSAPFYFFDTPTPRLSNVYGVSTNNAPSLALIGDRTVDEGVTLSFVASASDPDAGQTLTFSLDPGAPAAASINPGSGLFNWTPGELDGPGVFTVTVRVTDNGSPARSATRSLQITVNEVNSIPILNAQIDRTVAEGNTLSFVATASDTDVPANALSYSLDAGAPSGAGINSVTGLFLWTPREDQGPGLYSVTIRVVDNGTPPLSSAETFNITVTEVNTAPTLTVPPTQTVVELSTLTVTNTASDVDLPANTLTFGLVSAPSGATLDPATGVLTWKPTEAQGPSTNVVSVRVSDNGVPSLSVTQSFTVIVLETNSAPILTVPADQTLFELTTLTVTNTATDADLPAQSLHFELVSAPTGVSLNATNGILTWTPTEAQGPSTNKIQLRVSDSGAPSLSVTQSFTVIVLETNAAPTLTAIGSKTVDEGVQLAFKAQASDSDLPAQTLTYSLDPGAPAGAVITPTGAFTWTPTEAQGPGTFTVTVRVTDNGSPTLSDSETLTITVNEVNSAPILTPIGNKTIKAGSTLSFTAVASDEDVPAQILTFALDPGAPAGATITSAGAFSWSPTPAQSTAPQSITVRVTDNGSPALSASETFTVTVMDLNTAPVLAGISNLWVHPGGLASFTAAATDSDVPANVLRYSLAPGAPSGAGIDPLSGLFTWLVPTNAIPSTNDLRVVVTDKGTPPLTDGQSFTIIVGQTLKITQITEIDGKFSVEWQSCPGLSYRLQYTTAVAPEAWLDVGGDVTATGILTAKTDNAGTAAKRFYRVILVN